LLLSDNSAQKDMLKLSGQYGPLRFTDFTSSLPGEEKRYLIGHHLEIQPFHWLNIGVSETVIQGYDYENRYLNPFIVYIVLESEGKKSQNRNILVSVDFDLTTRLKSGAMPGLKLYSELLIDDFQLSEGKNAFKVWNSKLGLLAGFFWVDPLWISDTDLRVEYAALTQYSVANIFDFGEFPRVFEAITTPRKLAEILQNQKC